MHAKVTAEEKEFLINWLKGFPTVESHCCRNIPSYQNKKLFYPGTTQAQKCEFETLLIFHSSKPKTVKRFFELS